MDSFFTEEELGVPKPKPRLDRSSMVEKPAVLDRPIHQETPVTQFVPSDPLEKEILLVMDKYKNRRAYIASSLEREVKETKEELIKTARELSKNPESVLVKADHYMSVLPNLFLSLAIKFQLGTIFKGKE